MLREDMVARLIEDDKQTIIQALQNGDTEYLEDCLMYKDGYDNWTLRKIIDEYTSRTWEDE